MPPSVLLSHPSSLEHDTGAHPERAARIQAIEAELAARGGLGLVRRSSSPATRDQLHAVHPAEYVTAIEAFVAAGGGSLDADTVTSPGSFVAALHAAGGACGAVDALLSEEGVGFAASVHRPPGHHASRARPMGFCLFSNVAVAARHARDAYGVTRVLILDWDVHHGNGTSDIFWESPEVLFVSIHEWPMWPGTGAASDVGEGDGLGYTVNLPVAGGTGDDVFCSHVEHVVGRLARSYAPELILLSAGFDAHEDDPLAGCSVTDAGYAAMAASMRSLGAELDVPVGLVLEGGYDLGALSRSLCDVLEVFAADTPAAPPDIPIHPESERALERLPLLRS